MTQCKRLRRMTFDHHDVEYEAALRFPLANILWKPIVFSAAEGEFSPLRIQFAMLQQLGTQWVKTYLHAGSVTRHVFFLISLRLSGNTEAHSFLFTSVLLRVTPLSCQVFWARTPTLSKVSVSLLSHLISTFLLLLSGDDRYLRTAEFVQPRVVVESPITTNNLRTIAVDNNIFLIAVIAHYTAAGTTKGMVDDVDVLQRPVFHYDVLEAEHIVSFFNTDTLSVTANLSTLQEQAFFDGFDRRAMEKSVCRANMLDTSPQCTWAGRYLQSDFWVYCLRALPLAPLALATASDILLLLEQKADDDNEIPYIPWQEQEQWHGWLLLQWILSGQEMRQQPRCKITVVYVYREFKKIQQHSLLPIRVPCLYADITIVRKSLASIDTGANFWLSLLPPQTNIPGVIISDVNQRNLWRAHATRQFLFFQHLQHSNTIILLRLRVLRIWKQQHSIRTGCRNLQCVRVF